MLRFKSFLLCGLSFISIDLCAQSSQIQKFLPVIAPPGPEAAGMTRYGNYEVNLFTGTPDISIPVYEIKVGDMSVPITISYHAQGIKVNEIPSRVGLGWDLQAGGAITRQIMGKPDEVIGNYLDGTAGTWGGVESGSQIDPFTNLGLDYINNVDNSVFDVEPDIFSYSFPGHSGKFLFNQENSFKAFLIPFAPIAVNYSKPPLSNNLKLSINDENGNTYKFDSTEFTNASVGATSSWLLTDMISANKQDTIHFIYSTRTSAGITDSYFSDYVVVNDNSNNGAHDDLGTPSSSIGSTNTIWQQLNEIDFKNGKIVFDASSSARQDFNSSYQLQHGLKDIKIYSFDGLSGKYNLVKMVQFYQSYFISGTDAGTKRLRLDSLQMEGSDSAAVQSYQFSYNTATPLPVNTSRMKDYWGYFNNINNLRPDGVPIAIPKTQIDYEPTGTTIWIGGDHTNARDPDPTYMQADILQKISFPTGGNTQFEYETNQYLDAGVAKYAGGLRIKSIKSYTSSSATPVVKTYKYGTGESGYGRNNFFLENYLLVSSQNYRANDVCPMSTWRQRTYLANPTLDFEGYDGAAVVYPTVTEYIGDGTTNSGKTIYQFADKADQRTDITGYGKPIFDSYHFVRGMLANQTNYRRNIDNSYSKVAETRKGYQYFPFHFSTGGIGLVVYRVLVTLIGGNVVAPTLSVDASPCTILHDAPSWYLYTNYDLPTGDNKLIADTSIAYDQTDTTKFVMTTTSYAYDDTLHLGLTQTKTIDSKGDTIANTITYPYNYGTAPYTSMTTNHIFDKPVQQTKTDNSVQLTKQLTNYADFGNGNYLPQNIQFQVAANPIETRANFNYYDWRGNPLEMQKTNDMKQSYVWDYKGMYLTAEVTNASSTDIAYSSFETEGKGGWTFTGLQFTDGTAPTGIKAYALGTGSMTKNSLSNTTTYYLSYWSKSGPQTVSGSSATVTGRTVSGWTQYEDKIVNPTSVTLSGTGFVDEVRLYPAGALMTTRTYKPLVGITSQCDPNHHITYFYYDEFGRLTLIRDQDRNAIKKYAYNFSGKTENANFYFNAQETHNYTRNNCSLYYTGSSVTYTIPAETYNSTVSQADANNKAFADTLANGQAYANSIGACTYNPPMMTVQGYNSKSKSYNVRYTNDTTHVAYTFPLVSNPGTTTPIVLGTIPANQSYTVLFFPGGGSLSGTSVTYDVNNFTQTNTTGGATFNHIAIAGTTTARMY